ncbi:MAG: dockerin type I repeat-containing protein [Ruminococcus sp.]|nr:dockerin type I repeat-containing protein [Ruminococcus sp.]
MKKQLKKVFAVMTAGLFSALPVFNQPTNASAIYAGQQNTWRFVEKYSGIGLEWYSSIAVNKNGYTFGSSEKGSLILNDSNFQTGYDSGLSALISGYSSPPKINGTGYLSKSTWYTPWTTTSFSLDYSYETSKGSITTMTVLVGDINLDGCVNMLDANYIAEYRAQLHNGTDYLTEIQKLAGDVNNDGEVTVSDAATIAKYSEGGINHF